MPVPARCWLAVLALLGAMEALAAQETNPPVAAEPLAPPADPAQPPVAAPASSPSLPPVAQPVNPADLPSGANTPPAASGGLIVTSPAAEAFETAMTAYNSGQYADAVLRFSAFLGTYRQDRRREEAIFRLAESYRYLGRNDDALAAYAFQVKTYPEGPLRPSADLRRGALFFAAGQTAEAVAPLQRVVAQSGGDLALAASYLLGRCDLTLQKEAEGRALLAPLAAATPPNKFTGQAAQALAELDDVQAKYAEALPLWQTALANAVDAPTKAIVAARGGWSALQAGQAAPAEKLFQTAREIATDDATTEARRVANTGLLRLLFQQKRFGEWVAVYGPEKDRLLDSARGEILYALGHAQFVLKHWPESSAAFDQYLHEFGTQPNAVTAAYERFLALAQGDRTRTVAEAQAYLQAWPQSPYRARVQLLEAQQLSREKKFTEALPLWKSLAAEPAGDDWPHQAILLELARAQDSLADWPAAATSYQAYLDDVGAHPGGKGSSAKRTLQVQARLAVCLQNANQLLAATQAWKAVQSEAPAGSAEQQMALEALGLIYARGGPAQQDDLVTTFRALLDRFPQTQLKGLAAFSVGDALFARRDYAAAAPYLLQARQADPAAWQQSATQRLLLAAYARKDAPKALAYLKDYDALPAPTDPAARAVTRLPAPLFYWLAETARNQGDLAQAELFYTRVTQHPDSGELLAGAWWQLGEVAAARRAWPAAVAGYEKYRQLKPEARDATMVLLALGRAQLGAGNVAAATALGQQALLQEPEGPRSASSRMLLGEAADAGGNHAEAARMFATLALLFTDPKITPQAMSRAAEAFAQAGDAKSAADWRQKLQTQYPGYQPVSFL